MPAPTTTMREWKDLNAAQRRAYVDAMAEWADAYRVGERDTGRLEKILKGGALLPEGQRQALVNEHRARTAAMAPPTIEEVLGAVAKHGNGVRK